MSIDWKLNYKKWKFMTLGTRSGFKVKQARIYGAANALFAPASASMGGCILFPSHSRISRRHGNQSKFAAAIDCPASGLAGTFCRSTSPGAAAAAECAAAERVCDGWSLGPFIVSKCLDVKVFALAAKSRPPSPKDWLTPSAQEKCNFAQEKKNISHTYPRSLHKKIQQVYVRAELIGRRRT